MTLESYSDADLAKRAAAIRAAQDAEKAKADAERLKAQADRELKDFRLSGSTAPADVAMAGGQKDLFGPKTRGEKEAERAAKQSKPEAADFPNAASYHAALADFRKANPPAPRADTGQASSDRRAEIKRELAALEKQYKQRMNKDSGVVPPSIKSDALNSIARKMNSLDAELKELDAAKSAEKTDAPVKTEATISDADRDSMLMYLFGEQPKVIPSILKPLSPENPKSIQDHAKAMLDDLGEIARPYLKQWYMGLKYDPRASGMEGLSPAGEVDAFDTAVIGKEPATLKESTIEESGNDVRKLDTSGKSTLEGVSSVEIQGAG